MDGVNYTKNPLTLGARMRSLILLLLAILGLSFSAFNVYKEQYWVGILNFGVTQMWLAHYVIAAIKEDRGW
jgi:hypothetical protein